jgi:hypothetical protein
MVHVTFGTDIDITAIAEFKRAVLLRFCGPVSVFDTKTLKVARKMGISKIQITYSRSYMLQDDFMPGSIPDFKLFGDFHKTSVMVGE